MGRKLKIQPVQVKDFLEESNVAVTVSDIADYFGICVATVRKLLRTLRKDGEKFLPTTKGIIDAGKIEDADKAELVKQFGVWLVALLMTAQQLSQIGKSPLLQSKKFLESKEDRKKLREILLILMRTVDIIEVDHQLGE